MRKQHVLLLAVVLMFLAGSIAAGQDTLSAQVLRLLTRTNSWTAAQTFTDVTVTGTFTGTTTGGTEVGADTSLRLIGGGRSVMLTDTPMGGALYGEDVAENYSLGAFTPVDGSGLTQRFSQGFFKHVYASTLALTTDSGSDVVQPIALAVDGSIQLGSGRAVNAVGTVTASQLAATPTTFANLTATPVAGMLAYVTDSTTVTWGATITGTGSNRVLAFYNGANWTVAGK